MKRSLLHHLDIFDVLKVHSLKLRGEVERGATEQRELFMRSLKASEVVHL